MNRSLVAILKNYVNFSHTDWDKNLPWAVLCVNSAKQSSTKFTPFELVHGRTPRLPHESILPEAPPDQFSPEELLDRVRIWRRTASDFIINAQEKYKARHDSTHDDARVYQPGSLVLVRRELRTKGVTKKFLPRFI